MTDAEPASILSYKVEAAELGPPDRYHLVRFDPAPPAPDEVRIAIKSVGISYADTLLASGRYQVVPQTPYVPGTECAGIIEAVGAKISDLFPGQAIAATGPGGFFAQTANVERRCVSLLPAGLDFDVGSVLSLSYATAWHALADRGGLREGECLLVLGAAGATGYAAVQVGKALGAHVLALASTDEKRALARDAGADETIDSRSADLRDQIRSATSGRPVDVVFDPIGGPGTELAFRTLGWGGRHLVIGFVTGLTTLRTNLALIKGASLIGVDVRQFQKYEPTKYADNMDQIFAFAAQGQFRPAVAARYPLADFRNAMSHAASGAAAGRVIINPAI